MRASNHKGRIAKDGNSFNVQHNDRNFESEKDKHIIKEKSIENIYLIINENGEISAKENITFREHEKRMYAKLFWDSLNTKNEKAIAQRHSERFKTIDDYLDGSRTCPEEEILQLGKDGEYKEIDTFKECILDYIHEHQKRYPDIKILDAAIHADETSLHCHLRKVYTAPDKDGNLEVKQHQCLKNLGYELPDQSKARGQFNNLKIPYTEDTRTMWLDICQERNKELNIEKEPDKNNLSLELAEYKRQQEIEKLKQAESDMEMQRELIVTNDAKIEDQEEKIIGLDLEIEQSKLEVQRLSSENMLLQQEMDQLRLQNEKVKENTKRAEKALNEANKALEQASKNEQKLEQVRQQLSVAQKELKTTLSMKARAAEIHHIFGEKDTITYHSSEIMRTRAIGEEAYKHMKKAELQLNEVAKREKTVERKEKQINPLYRAAKEDREKAKDYLKNQEDYIINTATEIAQKIFDDFIQEEFEQDLPGKAKRLEKFADNYMVGDKSILELFKDQETKRQKEISDRWEMGL